MQNIDSSNNNFLDPLGLITQIYHKQLASEISSVKPDDEDMNHHDDAALETLRKLKRLLSDTCDKVQKTIDEVVLEKNNYSMYKGKYIKYSSDDLIKYMHVENVGRTYLGCTFTGPMFAVADDLCKTFKIVDQDIIQVVRKNFDERYITVITEEEYYKTLKDSFTKLTKDIFNKDL